MSSMMHAQTDWPISMRVCMHVLGSPGNVESMVIFFGPTKRWVYLVPKKYFQAIFSTILKKNMWNLT